MDEQHLEKYVNLIHQLLGCENGTQKTVLQQNMGLIDSNLLIAVEQYANLIETQDAVSAKWLRQLAEWLAQNLESLQMEAKQIEMSDAMEFAKEVIQLTIQTEGDRGQMHQFFQVNLSRLNEQFLAALPIVFDNWISNSQFEVQKSIAVVFRMFGDSIQRFSLGNQVLNIELAIVAYQLALRGYPREEFPLDWAVIQGNLANSYLKSSKGQKSDNIEQAIVAYHKALQVFTRETFPQEWADVKNHLALAYRDRIRENKDDNLEQSIVLFQQTLEVCTFDSFPQAWAMVQNNLALTYRERLQGKRADNIEQAITLCQQTLEVFTREAFPQDWAGAQSNLSIAYCERIRGERDDNLERAIAGFHEVLEVRTRDKFPREWAMTQGNLGIAYSNRILGKKTDNLERAISFFQQALQVYIREESPQEWAIMQNNLALAYRDRIHGEKADNIEKSITAFCNALEIRTYEAFPQDWAMTQSNLALAYRDRIHEERTDNLEKSIAACQQALRVYTCEGFPQDWAMTQNNLATMYYRRVQGDKANNIKQAITACQLALQVYTGEAFPNDCRRTSRNLADIHFGQQDWNAAAPAYDMALAAAESLYQNCLFLEGQAAELSETGILHHRAAYAHAQNGYLQKALLTLELGRARGLSDSLARDRADLDQLQTIRPDLFDHYQTLTQEIRNLEIQQRNPDTNYPDQLRQALIQTRQALTETIATIQQVKGYQTFLKPPVFGDITRALKSEQAIVYITTTPAGSLALILTPNSEIYPVWLNELNQEQLQKLINEWFSAYNQQQSDRPKWFNTIDQTTQILWDKVMGTIVQKLTELHLPQAVLIPTGYLGLLPLHASWTADNTTPTGKCYALDTIHFTYAPNARSLREARELADRTSASSILAIDNPTQDLANATREIKSALHCFGDRSTHLRHAQATQAAVLNALPQHTVLHCACHGTANLTAPLDSGLVMFDRLLTLRDIFALKLNQQDSGGIRLAILSACETGLSGTETIDEVISLPTGLLQAGVAGIAASLWSVADLSTMMLLTRFYDLWRKEDQEPTLALRQAQQWVRDTTSQQKAKYFEKTSPDLFSFLILCKPDYFSHPFHWAAFTYTGV
jgi:CHAT domain-containing protein